MHGARYKGLWVCVVLCGILVAGASCQSSPLPPTPTAMPTPVPPTATVTPRPLPTPTVPAVRHVKLESALGLDWQHADVIWSPDNRTIAVTYWAGPSAQTFIVDARTGEPNELLADDYSVGMVAWSHDGWRLAAVAGDDMDTQRQGVWSFSGGRATRLLDGACEDLTWSPDGNALAATCELVANGPDALPQLGGQQGGGQLWRVNADGANARRLIDLVSLPLVAWSSGTGFEAARHPIWSLDGKQIAFEVKTGIGTLAPELGVAVMGARGESARLVVARPVWLGGWLANDRLIVRSRTASPAVKDYVDDFYAVDLATDKLQNLTRSDPNCEPLQSVTCGGAKRLVSLNADYLGLAPARNKYFYRATSGRDIIGGKTDRDWLVVNTFPPSDLTLEQSVERTNPMGERIGFATWLADGRLAYARYLGVDPEQGVPTGKVTAQFIIDGKVVRKEDIGTWSVFSVGWSPDGRRVAVATDFGVIIYGLP